MVEFGTVRFRTGGHVDEYPVAAGFFECVLLQVGGLVAGADARSRMSCLPCVPWYHYPSVGSPYGTLIVERVVGHPSLSNQSISHTEGICFINGRFRNKHRI